MLDRAAPELGDRAGGIERRHMRKPDKATGIVAFRLPHAIVDQAASRKVRLVDARTAREHRHVDAGVIHHPNMRRKIGKQRIEPVIGIAVLVEANGTGVRARLHQFGRV